jgi:hypothetical protein
VDRKIKLLLLPVVLSFAGVLLLLGLITASSAFAHEQEGATFSVQLAPEPVTQVSFTLTPTKNTVSVTMTSLTGEPIGTGTQEGKVRCHGDNCNQKINISYIPLSSYVTGTLYIEYKFTSSQFSDPVAKRLVVDCTGSISEGGPKQRFSCTASFSDNGDGTITAIYAASREDASLIVPNYPGRMVFGQR